MPCLTVPVMVNANPLRLEDRFGIPATGLCSTSTRSKIPI